VKKRNELVEMISSETELLDACAAWAKGKTKVQRMVKAMKIATALRALMMGAPKPRTDPALSQIFAVRGLALHVARACGISPQAIGKWQKVPSHHVAKISGIIGMPPHEIRPDLFTEAVRPKMAKRRSIRSMIGDTAVSAPRRG
jgi:hypothetical protein